MGGSSKKHKKHRCTKKEKHEKYSLDKNPTNDQDGNLKVVLKVGDKNSSTPGASGSNEVVTSSIAGGVPIDAEAVAEGSTMEIDEAGEGEYCEKHKKSKKKKKKRDREHKRKHHRKHKQGKGGEHDTQAEESPARDKSAPMERTPGDLTLVVTKESETMASSVFKIQRGPKVAGAAKRPYKIVPAGKPVRPDDDEDSEPLSKKKLSVRPKKAKKADKPIPGGERMLVKKPVPLELLNGPSTSQSAYALMAGTSMPFLAGPTPPSACALDSPNICSSLGSGESVRKSIPIINAKQPQQKTLLNMYERDYSKCVVPDYRYRYDRSHTQNNAQNEALLDNKHRFTPFYNGPGRFTTDPVQCESRAQIVQEYIKYKHIKIDFNQLRTLSDLGIDCTFLTAIENEMKNFEFVRRLQEHLSKNLVSFFLDKLKNTATQQSLKQQPVQLQQQQPHLGFNQPLTQEKIILAKQEAQHLTDVVKTLPPSALALQPPMPQEAPHTFRKPIGLPPKSDQQHRRKQKPTVRQDAVVMAALPNINSPHRPPTQRTPSPTAQLYVAQKAALNKTKSHTPARGAAGGK